MTEGEHNLQGGTDNWTLLMDTKGGEKRNTGTERMALHGDLGE